MSDGKSKKRLGRGLAALIGEMDDQPVVKANAPTSAEVTVDKLVPIELIRANPNNPRRFFAEDYLTDLARSIAEHGIVQPLLVRPVKDKDLAGSKYEIIAGERRWRAAQKAALHEVPIVIRDVEDKEALELAIIENVQRADLNPVEEAMGYQQLIDDYDYTQSDLGGVIGKSRSHVANTLRLLKLPDEVQKLVSGGDLSAGHARALITSQNPSELARRIVKDGLSVRQAEELGQKPNDNKKSQKTGTRNLEFKSADTRALEKEIEDALGFKIDIRHKENGNGDIKLKYNSLDQLQEICDRLLKK